MPSSYNYICYAGNDAGHLWFLMNLVSAILDYLIWPALMAGSLAGLAYGTAHGNDELAFNTIYLCLALTLLFLERLRPHEVEWLKSDGQEMPDLLHTLITKLPVQVIVIVVMNLSLIHISEPTRLLSIS